MARSTITISKPIKPADDTGMTVRRVVVRVYGKDHEADCYFRIVNGRAVFSVGECADESFKLIVATFVKKGERQLAALLP